MGHLTTACSGRHFGLPLMPSILQRLNPNSVSQRERSSLCYNCCQMAVERSYLPPVRETALSSALERGVCNAVKEQPVDKLRTV